MFHQRHRLFFPGVIIFLTLVLITLMVWQFYPQQKNKTFLENKTLVQEKTFEAEDLINYQPAVTKILNNFYQKYNEADQDFLKVILADKTLDQLLALKVPSQYKELHLKIAVDLNLIQHGLTDQPENLKKGLDNLHLLNQEYPWLP